MFAFGPGKLGGGPNAWRRTSAAPLIGRGLVTCVEHRCKFNPRQSKVLSLVVASFDSVLIQLIWVHNSGVLVVCGPGFGSWTFGRGLLVGTSCN